MTSPAPEELIAFRRMLHAHPELSREEHQTTLAVSQRLEVAGLAPKVLPAGTGLICDIGDAGAGPTVALRADIDALAIDDVKDVPYRSQVQGVCHACGHDVHTTVLLGTALELAQRQLPGRVRLLFQPAEETVPGGALDVIAAGGLDDVAAVYGLHCDPSLEVGRVGTRVGAITSAADLLTITLVGPGGHTARPHLTADLVHLAGRVATELPSALGRLLDVRGGLNLVFGSVHGGEAANVIPTSVVLRGTARALQREAWDAAPDLIRRLLDGIVGPMRAEYHLDYDRGAPPIINDRHCTTMLDLAATTALGPDSVTETAQSMGGEDFSWYLEHRPGSFARLGVKPAGSERPAADLHSGAFDVDESAIDVGVKLLTQLALDSLTAAR
ncbi:MAG TPA: amidohydrolase [Acidimicrobiales bacterium]|nr:amidohydrolase [Acidimicrobiales bacterium]